MAAYLRKHPHLDVSSPDASGMTPLCVVSSSGNVEMVAMLLKHRADPNVRSAAMHDATDVRMPFRADMNARTRSLYLPLVNR